MDDKHEVMCMGKDAKNTLSLILSLIYCNNKKWSMQNINRYITTPMMKDKWMLFDRFKMALYHHVEPTKSQSHSEKPSLNPSNNDDEKNNNQKQRPTMTSYHDGMSDSHLF